MRLAWVLVLVAGCAANRPPPMLGEQLGESHRPYTALPAYLMGDGGEPNNPSDQREPVVGSDEGGGDLARTPVAGRQAPDANGNGPVFPRAVPGGARLQRLRAQLAALDALVVALPDTPTAAQRQALNLTLAEVRESLKDYPDLNPQLDEIERLSAQLPSVPPPRLPRLKVRIGDAIDSLRLQLMAAR